MSLTHDQRRDRRLAIAEFSANHSDSEAARKFGVCILTCRNARKEYAISKSPERVVHTATPKTVAILARLLNGEKQSEIAKDTGLSRQRISSIFKSAQAAGLFAVRKGNPKKEK